MYGEEVFMNLTKTHIKRCYRALVLAEKMTALYIKRMEIKTPFWPEDLEEPDEEFRQIMEEYLTGEGNNVKRD